MTTWWREESSSSWMEALGLSDLASAWSPDLPGEVVNDRGDRQVLRLHLPSDPRICYLKRWRFDPGSIRKILPGARDLRLRTGWEFRNLRDLQALGIRVPKPLLFGETSNLWGPTAAILVLEELTGYIDCQSWIQGQEPRRERAARGIADLLGQLHSQHLYYRSPGLKHFYIRLEGESDQDRFAMLDLARLDRGPAGLKDRWMAGLGNEIPGIERDLSKVLLALGEGKSLSRGTLESFWEAYRGSHSKAATDPGLIARVEQDLARRETKRRARSDRKAS